jgi:hypothetical protein
METEKAAIMAVGHISLLPFASARWYCVSSYQIKHGKSQPLTLNEWFYTIFFN